MRYFIFLPIAWILLGCAIHQKSECNYITDYYQTIYRADIEFIAKNYQKAFDLYQHAFNSCRPINTLGYNEIYTFAEVSEILGKRKLALTHLELAIRNGLPIITIEENDAFTDLLNSKEGEKLLENYNNIRREYMASINLQLRSEIQKMIQLDQRYRSNKHDWKKQDSIDTINASRLIEIFEQYGYPNESVIGHNSIDMKSTTVDIILLHTADSIRINYFVPKLTEFIKQGTCSPNTLALIVDQFYMYNDQPQIYGTIRGKNSRYHTMINDLQQVDKNRIAIGLPPLKLSEKRDSLRKQKYNKRSN
ncbi:MAG: hypothetical protein OQJ83_10145 [Altibacter sp.]|nr:hypothetical protein [Altibacter sp.]